MCIGKLESFGSIFFFNILNNIIQQLNKYCKISLARGVFFVLHPVLKKV